jgi:uncharacterized protein with HEPN domain
MQPDILDALEDIVEHIEYVLEDIDGVTWSFFQEDRQTRQLVMYNIMIIGEAANRISKIDKSVLQEFPGLALSVPTRNALIHGYDTARNSMAPGHSCRRRRRSSGFPVRVNPAARIVVIR